MTKILLCLCTIGDKNVTSPTKEVTLINFHDFFHLDSIQLEILDLTRHCSNRNHNERMLDKSELIPAVFYNEN